MSNLQFPPQPRKSLSPEWRALARIGESFRKMYNLIIYPLLCLLFAIPVGIVFFIVGTISRELGSLLAGLVVLAFLVGIVVWIFYGLYITIQWWVRMWKTPVSLVPGGEIARTFITLVLLTLPLGFIITGMQVSNPNMDKSILLPAYAVNFLLGIATFILFVKYLYRLSDAVRSQRVQNCLKWFITSYIVIMCTSIVNLMSSTTIDPASIEREGVPAITIILGLLNIVFGLIQTISILYIDWYLAKDIEAFVAQNCPKIPSNPQDFPMNFPQGDQQGFPMNFPQDNPSESPENQE